MTDRTRLPADADAPRYVVFGRSPFEGVRHVWHHVALRLARRGPLVYVRDAERPSWTRRWHASAVNALGVREVTPIEFPLQRLSPARRACARSSARAVLSCLEPGRGPLVAIAYPRSAIGLATACRPDLLVYHATDDFSHDWTGRPDERFLRWEREALERAGLAVAVISTLADRLRRVGHPRVELLPNGFDESTFDGRVRPVPPDLGMLPRPILGYAGSVYPEKLDAELLEAVARRRPGWSFALVGPIFDEGSEGLARLRAIPGLHLLGPRPFEEVPAYVGAFDAAINPHRPDPAGREFRFYPLKAYDALAMGRPVVLTPRSSLCDLAPHASFAADASGFVAAVEAALADNSRPGIGEVRRAAVAQHSWARRVESLDRFVQDALAAGARPMRD